MIKKIDENEKSVTFIRSEIEKKLNEHNTDELSTTLVKANINFQSRHHLKERNWMAELLLTANKNNFYWTLYLLYFTSPQRHPALKVSQRFSDFAARLLSNPHNRATFIKWHVIHGIESCTNLSLLISNNNLIREIAEAKDPESLIEEKYWDLKWRPGFFNKPLSDILEDGLLLSAKSRVSPSAKT